MISLRGQKSPVPMCDLKIKTHCDCDHSPSSKPGGTAHALQKVSLKNSSAEQALGSISFPSEAGEQELPRSKVPGCLLCITTLGLHRDGKGKGWGWSRAQLPRLLPAVSQTAAQPPGWRRSLVKDSACFLWCYLRICHSLWEPGPTRSDS